jgi:hypothetical protein
MPRLCINCLLSESACQAHAPHAERRAYPMVEQVGAIDSSKALKDLCEF